MSPAFGLPKDQHYDGIDYRYLAVMWEESLYDPENPANMFHPGALALIEQIPPGDVIFMDIKGFQHYGPVNIRVEHGEMVMAVLVGIKPSVGRK